MADKSTLPPMAPGKVIPIKKKPQPGGMDYDARSAAKRRRAATKKALEEAAK